MGSFDKQKIVAAIVKQLQIELEDILRSAEAARGGALHEDAQAKSKYDTHGLELSYLAGAQFERANVLQSQIIQYQELQLKYFSKDDPIGVSALIELKNSSGSLFIFLGINGVSTKVEVDGNTIQLITPQSPLGEELLGLYEGDELQMSKTSAQKKHTIIALH